MHKRYNDIETSCMCAVWCPGPPRSRLGARCLLSVSLNLSVIWVWLTHVLYKSKCSRVNAVTPDNVKELSR